VGETDLPVCDPPADRFFDCEIDAIAGPNLVELDVFRWTQSPGERPLSILISGMALAPIQS
jgi:hypothetical protein